MNLNSANWQYTASKASFEGANLAADGFYDEDGKASYSTSVKLMGSKSVRIYNNTVCQGTPSCGAARIYYEPTSSGSDLYASGYIRYASGSTWPGGYMKMYLTSGPSQWYFQPSGTSQFLLKQGGWYGYIGLPASIAYDRWYHWEIRMRTGSPNIYTVWWDGQQIANLNPSSGQNIEWIEFGIPNYDGVNSGQHVEVFFDNVVHSSSRIYPASKIEVSNNPVYGSGTIKYQEPVGLGDASAQIKLDLSGLGSGPYYLWVTNNRQETSNSYVLGGGSSDTMPPTVSVTSPSGGATVSATVTVSASATDNLGVAGVQFKLNGVNLGTEDTSSPYSISWNTTMVSSGTHTLTAIARDSAGNQTTSSSVSVIVNNAIGDTTPPTVSVISPSGGATVSGTVTVSANASDNLGVVGVQFKLNSSNLGSEDTSNPYSISWNTTAVSNGTYTLTAVARDAAGNQGTSSSVSVLVNNSSGSTSGATILFEEKFDDTNFSSRGWYDNTSLVLSSTEHIVGSTKSLEYRYSQGTTKPVSGSSIRRKFSETESIYISYWVKYSSNWTGSNKTYHPHEFMILTNQNGDWDNLAYTKLNAYIEQNEGEPLISIQDGQNIDESRVGQDLTAITEARAVAGCNGDSDGYGDGSCYAVGTNEHWNGKTWRAEGIYFTDNPGPYYKNDWHSIEAYIKLNSIAGGKAVEDGVLKYWYDGNLIIDINNVVLRTGQYPDMKFNQLVIAPWIGDGSPVDQTFWIDNLTMATGRPGGNTPPTPTPPTTPTGLRTQ